MVKEVIKWVRSLKFREKSANRATSRALLMICRRQLGSNRTICNGTRSN